MIDRRDIANLYPLSPLQEGMLFHAQREPGSRAYFEQLDFEPAPLPDPQAYLQAWQDLVQRHDILRTVFALRNLQQPLQIVLRERALATHCEDLQALDPAAAEAVIADYRARDLAQGFALTDAVPMRLALFTLPGGRQRVVWSFHHILLDGWSLAILQSDLEQLHRARLAGRTAALPPAAPYAAYVRWLTGRDRAQGLAFWQQHLQGLAAATPVPRRLDARLAPPAGPGARGECRHPLSPEARQGLARLAAGQGVTTSLVVQCVWGLLLARLHGRRDAAFATTVSGRPADLPGAERTVGLFINAVPVRVRWQAGDSCAGLLARMQAEAVAGQAHHDSPLAEVQAAHPLGQALFDHILVFENYPQLPPGAAQEAERAVHLHEYTHYPFEFQFLPGEAATLRMRFDASLFDAASIAGLARDFETALLAAASDPQAAVDGLAWPADRGPGPARLAIAASFTAEPIAQALAWWFDQLACPVEVQLAPYNQCPQQLAAADSMLRRADIGLLLLRFGDATRDLEGMPVAHACARLDAQCALLLDLVRERGTQPLLVALLPASDDTGPLAAHVALVEERWRSALAALQGVTLLDLRSLEASYGLAEVFDPVAERLGHLPFAPAACEAIAAELARAVHAGRRPPFKVVALDCDNTLWQGVVGELGPLHVHVGPAQRELQQFLLALRERGFLLALASKNHEDDVWAVFDRHPDMLLRREHIAAAAIGWYPKSDGLRQIARQLGFGLDSIVLVDDSPVECTGVMQHCPQAFALVLPPEPASHAAWLRRAWAFDQPHVTAEDRDRSGMLLAEARRQAALGDAGPADLLAQLGLQVRIGVAQPHQLPRLAQLTQRTNQFNLSGRRRDETQLARLLASADTELLAVEVEDRFGAYGLTGMVVATRVGDTLELDTLLLSCRVLGRQVEWALLQSLAARARRHGCGRIVAPLRATDRNEPVRLFLSAGPWQPAGDGLFICDAEFALPGTAAVEVIDDTRFEPASHDDAATPPAMTAAAAARPGAPRFPDRFPMPIVNEAALRHGAQYLPLLAACAGWPGRALRQAAGAAARAGRPAATPSERAVADIFGEVLGRDVVDADAPFTALGGHSLHAVRVVSRLERHFGRAIALQVFLEPGSVAAVAAWFDAAQGESTAAAAIARAPEAPDYPLSHNQQRLWLLAQMGGTANLHNLCAAFRLRGPLQVSVLEAALQQLVARHPALRSVIRLRDQQPRQLVLPLQAQSLPVQAADGGEEALRARIARRSRVPFDLEAGPLFRAELHRLAAQDHVLALHLHHVVSDGWSFGLLLDDLAALYAAACGEAVELPAAPSLRYVDFASWSRSSAGEQARAADGAWWCERLLPLAPIARIAPDDPAAAEGSEGAVVHRVLPLSAAALQAWSARHGATLFGLLAALVATLLWRCGGEAAVRLGMPAAGRTRAELEGIVGFFANTTVLATQLQPEQPFTALLAAVQRSVAGALEHQSYPFDRLVADLQPEREAGRHPLFDALVVLQNARGPGRSLPGLEVDNFEVDTGLAEFDLVFEFGEVARQELVCALRYRRGFYSDATASLLLDRLLVLLHGVVEQPVAPLRSLPLLGAGERQRLEALGQGGHRAIPPATIAQLFAAQAARTPHLTAVADGQYSLDYQALDRRANAFAHVLVAQGVAPGDVVAVLLDRAVPWAVTLLATLKAGAVYLPLDLHHPAQRQRRLLAQARPRLLVAAAADQGVAEELVSRALLPPSGSQAESPPAVAADPMATAYLIFTSGSTGEPKGVRVQHRAFVNMVLAQIEAFAVTPTDTVLQVASCSFDASLSELFMAWLCGAGLAIASHAGTRDGALLAAEIRQHAATVATFTPSHLRQLDDEQLSGLRKVILAGEAVLGHDVRRLQARGIEVFNAYGPTETAVCASLMRIDVAPAAAAPVPIGRPLPNLRMRVVDGFDRDAPIGVAGEIVVEGEGVALGYLGNPGNTAFFTAADGGRGYRTGDVGRWRPDGALEYLGRKDTQVKIRGHRIEPGEVAAALAALPGVRQAEVLLRQGPLGPYLAACLSGEPQSEAQLRGELALRLPAHMIPARFAWLERMPLTRSGKLDRAALEAACDRPVEPTARPVTARPLEGALLALWRSCLPGEIGLDTDFFEAGGDSLAAMHAARRIGRELGRPCSALQFFRTPTVRAMAAALLAAPNEPGVASFGSGQARIFALPPYPGLEAGYATLARALPQATLHVLPFTDRPGAELVDRYVGALHAMAGEEPAVLLGYSGGGQLALAVAAALAGRRPPPEAVILIDTWRWSEASPQVQGALDQAMDEAAGAAADTALAAAYRQCLLGLQPRQPIASPLHHLLASEAPAAPPPGLSRDWRALAGAGYFEHAVAGDHHRLLDAAHVGQTAACLGRILEQLQ